MTPDGNAIGTLAGVPVHLGFKPLIEHIPLETPLAADFRRRDTAFPRELIDRHDVEPQILRHLTEGHDALFAARSIFLHGQTSPAFLFESIHNPKNDIQYFYYIFTITI